MGENESNEAVIIKDSGCKDIQEAVQAIENAGYKLDYLDEETLKAVVGIVASADSVGGQAGHTKS